MLTITSYSATEAATPGGGGEGGAVGGGGEPLRYGFTSRGFAFLQSWNDANYTYSILQLYKGYNPLSKIEVVSSLNFPMQANAMYYFDYAISVPKYNPKLYLGTLQTIGKNWIIDRQTYAGSDIKMPENWPQNPSQKGEL